jgi:glutathione synthase/RimK-type ligase-like ATP-grasp enzyme
MTDVLLVTCADLPDGEECGYLLTERFADRGVSANWVAWDDPAVAWSEADLVAVRSPWDYDRRLAEFLDWARSVESSTRLLNGARVFEWNTDKAYLVELMATGLPVVPTVAVDDPFGLADAVARFQTAVIKPRIGAGGRGVVFATSRSGCDAGSGPWVVQPLVESVRTEGETSVFVLGGNVISQIQKRPAQGEIRVQEEYGGSSEPVDVTAEAADLALRAVRVAERLLEVELPYARVDLMRLDDGELALGELELTEPGLYLDLVPANADAFAEVVLRLLRA